MPRTRPSRCTTPACRPACTAAAGLALAIATTMPACGHAQDSTRAAGAQRTMQNAPTPHDRTIAEAATRLRAMHTATAPLVILMQTGPGPGAAAAAEQLRAALRSGASGSASGDVASGDVVFARVDRQHGGPAPDAGRPGGHVNVVTHVVTPPPSVVVAVAERDGRLTIVARPPGSDPLGPPASAPHWILTSP